MAISMFKGTIPVEDWSELGQSVNQSLNKFFELNRQEEARQRKQRSEDEAKYLADAKKDPVYTASAYWQQDQAKHLQQLQSKIGQVYRNAKQYYHPDLQGRLEIQNHLAAFNMYQQKIKGNMDEYEKAFKQIKSDPHGIKYDHDHFAQRVKEWSDPKGDGTLAPDLLLPPMPESREGFWQIPKNQHKGTGQMKLSNLPGGKVAYGEVPLNEDQKRSWHDEWVHQNPGYTRKMVEDWSKADPETRKKYLENDSSEDSAILKWDYDTAGKTAFPLKYREAQANEYKNDRLNKVQATASGAEDEIPITLGRYADGKKQTGYVKAEGDVYSFTPGSEGSITLSQKINPETGKLEKTKPNNNNISIKNLTIKYFPFDNKGMITHRTGDQPSQKAYLNKDGEIREPFKLRAVGITSDGEKFLINNETKGKLRTKFPNNVHKMKTSSGDAVNIDDIPLTIDKGEQNPDYKEPEDKPAKTTKQASQKEYKVTNQQLMERAKKEGMSPDKFKKEAEKMGYKIIITK
jgi:hypothetical protein